MTVSFIMPAYKLLYLEDAIQSILSQTSPDWELVVVDDCSPENLSQIIDKYEDNRISYYRNDINIGGKDLVAQWNHSIKYAKGDWIVLAADDDLYEPTFCEEIIKLTRQYPNIDLIRSRVNQIDEEGKVFWSETSYPEYISGYEFLHDWLVGKSFTCVGNYAFRRKALEQMGGFINFPCGFCSDLATPIQLAANGVANTRDLLFNFRQTPVHLSADRSKYLEKLKAITLYYTWLAGFEYPMPASEEDVFFYSFKNQDYIHAKCIYDYFNQVVKYVPLSELPLYLKSCSLANSKEKMVYILRWFKNRMCH